MAERMGRLRAKEAAKRAAFLAHVERFLPAPLLAGLGLLAQPPHCHISVPAAEAGLLRVTMDDIRAVPLPADPQVGFSVKPFGPPCCKGGMYVVARVCKVALLCPCG